VTELQQNRYDQLLRRVGDLKGPGSKVNDVLHELFPTLDVENVPGELLFLMGTRIGWGAASKAPTAGKKSGIQLFNPVGSGHMVTISTVVLSTASATQMSWGIVTIALATNTGIPRIRDSRAGTGPGGISELRTSPDAVALTNGQLRLASNTSFLLTDPNAVCILFPGTGMSVVGSTDDVIAATFNYRERVIEPSELFS